MSTQYNAFQNRAQLVMERKMKIVVLLVKQTLRSSIFLFLMRKIYSNPEKKIVGCGIFLGFRGNKEHKEFSFDQIVTGHFPSNHPSYPNYQWCGINHFSTDKTMKQNFNTNYVRKVEEALGRFPILSDGKRGHY